MGQSDQPERIGHPAIPTEELHEVEGVEAVRIKRLSLRRADVVSLEEAFEHDLPVCRDLAFTRGEQPLLRRQDLRQLIQRAVGQARLVFHADYTTFENAARVFAPQKGATPDDVARLQTVLQQLGYMDMVTGYYGEITMDAVTSFQQDSGIYATGTYGAITRMALAARMRPPVARNDILLEEPEMRVGFVAFGILPY